MHHKLKHPDKSSSDKIVQRWKEVNSKSMANIDAKLKLKYKLDLLFFAVEKETVYDVKPALKRYKQAVIDFLKKGGNTFNHGMFVK